MIALGNGVFRAVGYTGGLPGDGWNGKEPEAVTTKADNGRITFAGRYADGTLRQGKLDLVGKDGKAIGSLPRVERRSPTLGKNHRPKPAYYLMGKMPTPGSRTRNRGAGQMTPDGLLMEGHNSKDRFGDHQLHLEFFLPFEPHNRGQGAGQQRLLSARALRSSDSRLLRSGGSRQRVWRNLQNRPAEYQHVLPTGHLADVRHSLPYRPL